MPARTLPGLGLQAFFNLGEDGWNDEMDNNMLVLSALVNRNVLSRTTTIPGSPALGAIYIVPSGDANGNSIAVWDGPSGSEIWTYLTPDIGWHFYVEDEDVNVQWNGLAWVEFAGGGESSSGAYDIRSGFNTTPGSDELLDTILIPRAISFPANFSGSLGLVGVNPTSSFEISVRENDVEFGVITIGTDGSFVFSTDGGLSHSFTSGNSLSFVGPSTADTTVANATWTLKGSS